MDEIEKGGLTEEMKKGAEGILAATASDLDISTSVTPSNGVRHAKEYIRSTKELGGGMLTYNAICMTFNNNYIEDKVVMSNEDCIKILNAVQCLEYAFIKLRDGEIYEGNKG